MSYFNVFFQAAICHSWFPAAKLRLKNNPTVTIVTVGY